jgi:hypothetical protein
MRRTRRVSGSCLGLLVALACHSSSREEVFDANIPLHPHSGEPALASLHVERASPLSGLAEQSEALPLRIALWADGTLCWSGDLQHGGAPYSVTHVGASQVTEVLEKLRSILDVRVGSAPSYVVPDSETSQLALLDGQQFLGMASSIEAFERNPDLVATEHGVDSLQGRDRREVTAAQSGAHQRLRTSWGKAVEALSSLIPPSGERLDEQAFESVHWDARSGRGSSVAARGEAR